MSMADFSTVRCRSLHRGGFPVTQVIVSLASRDSDLLVPAQCSALASVNHGSSRLTTVAVIWFRRLGIIYPEDLFAIWRRRAYASLHRPLVESKS